jgi:galactitol-specific phosphotransferase system IIB component
LNYRSKKYLTAFGNDIIDAEQLKKAMDDLRLKRSVVEKQIAILTKKEDRSDVIIPSEEVIENYTVGIRNILANADFSLKRNIIEKSIDKVVATQETAIVSGCIQIEKEYTNVNFKIINWHRWPTKCWEVNPF